METCPKYAKSVACKESVLVHFHVHNIITCSALFVFNSVVI